MLDISSQAGSRSAEATNYILGLQALEMLPSEPGDKETFFGDSCTSSAIIDGNTCCNNT